MQCAQTIVNHENPKPSINLFAKKTTQTTIFRVKRRENHKRQTGHINIQLRRVVVLFKVTNVEEFRPNLRERSVAADRGRMLNLLMQLVGLRADWY